MSDKPIRASEVSTNEALEIYMRGGELICPSLACSARLATIPANVPPGVRPMGLICPVNGHHFFFYGEDAEVMKAARKALRRIASGSDDKEG